MRWIFSMEMEDTGRMISRALLPFDHLRVAIESLAAARTDNAISLTVVVEADVEQSKRIEALLWKIHGTIQIHVARE